MTRDEKLKTINGLYWDFHIDPEEYLGILEGRLPGNREKIVARMLERLYWCDLVGAKGIIER